MDALRELIDEIKRMQLLICLYRGNDQRETEPVPLGTVSEELRITTDECGTVARGLMANGLVECLQHTDPAVTEQVRLTAQGRRWIEALGECTAAESAPVRLA